MEKQELPSGMPETAENGETVDSGEAVKTNAALALVKVQGTVTEISRVEAGLAQLRAQYQNVAYAVGTTEGMKDAKAARIDIRETRYAIDKVAKASKDALNALKKDIDGRALSINSALVELETPIHEQIKAEEDRVAAEKEVIKAAKAEAAAKAQTTIDNIRSMAVQAATMTAADIDALRVGLDGTDLLNEVLGERTGEALQAKMQTQETLDLLHGAAVKREAEATQAAADRAELDKMRAERAERERQELADRQAAEQAEQSKRDEANRAAEQKLADDRAAFAKEMADARAQQQAEADRLAAKQAELDRAAQAEQKRKDDQAAAEKKRLDEEAAAKRAEADRVAAQERAEQLRQEEEARQTEATQRAEAQRQADEAAAQARAEADRLATEKRAADEAAHKADQRGRDAWRELLAVAKEVFACPGMTSAIRANAQAAIELSTGEAA